MSVAWVDASVGAAGDMLMAALVDAGAPLDAVRAAVAAVSDEPLDVDVEVVRRGGLRALRAEVTYAPTTTRRTWSDLRARLQTAALDDAVRADALRVFGLLADAEAAVHGTAADDVHFHEVGALDSVADVVGVCAAMRALGIDRLTCSPVAVGSGTVRTEHGLLPVPAPAVVRLLAAAGAPSYAGPHAHEACTPTAAALLAALASDWGPQPPMVVRAVGMGAGTRDLDGTPNLVRVLVGDAAPEPGGERGPTGTDEAVVLSANVDDMDPRLWPGVLRALLAAGALDAWLVPILMKKGRPASTLHVLARPADVASLGLVVVEHTTTLGVRVAPVSRLVLDREVRRVLVAGVEVAVKVALLDGRVVTVQPEYEDVAAAAEVLGRPERAVLAAAAAAADAGAWV